MAIETPCASTIKIKFDAGIDVLTSKRKYVNKTYSSVKSTASNENIMEFVDLIEGLQQNTVHGTTRTDCTQLSE